jgi:catecholate siderophore receptor
MSCQQPISSALAALCAALFTTGALAQTIDAPQTLDAVQVTGSRTAATLNVRSSAAATRTDTALRDVPQIVIVVPRDLFEAQGATTLTEVLRNVPGVAQHDGDGRRDQLVIRGFRAGSDQFINGVRDPSTARRDLVNVERVEVIKGPASVLYGRGSSGGIVNRVTKSASYSRIASVGLSVGSFGFKRAELDLGGALVEGSLAYRLNVGTEDSDSFRDQVFLRRTTVAPSLLWDLSSDTHLSFDGLSSRSQSNQDGGIPTVRGGGPVGVPVSQYYGSPVSADDRERSSIDIAMMTLEHRISAQLSFRNVLSASAFSSDNNNNRPGTATFSEMLGGVLSTRRNSTLSHSDSSGYSNQAEWVLKLPREALLHTLLFGIELSSERRDQLSFERTSAPVAVFNPVLTRPTQSAAQAATPSTNSESQGDTVALYLQDQIDIGRHWKALVGLRYDDFQVTSASRLPNTAKTAVSLDSHDKAWSPRAGLVYQPSSSLSLYSGYSRSFQPSGETLSLAANNKDLGPEQTTNIEVGLKADYLDGKVSVQGAIFNLQRDNIKTADLALQGGLVQTGVKRTRGLELSMAGELARGWSAWAGYAFMDGRIVESTAVNQLGVSVKGNVAGETPRHSANLWTSYRFANHFSIGGGLNYQASAYNSQNNLMTLPSYVRTDGMLSYRGQQIEYTLNLLNAFNQRYFQFSDNDTRSAPGAPRTLRLTVRASI